MGRRQPRRGRIRHWDFRGQQKAPVGHNVSRGGDGCLHRGSALSGRVSTQGGPHHHYDGPPPIGPLPLHNDRHDIQDSKSYSIEDAAIIWSQWESYIQVPQSHPLAGDGLARDRIIAMLQTICTVPKPTAADAQALTEFVSVAIPAKTFTLFNNSSCGRNGEPRPYSSAYLRSGDAHAHTWRFPSHCRIARRLDRHEARGPRATSQLETIQQRRPASPTPDSL